MPIHPLPQFEADLKELLDEQDRLAYEALQPPKTIVVRFGAMKLVGEFPYDGAAKPGCGSRLVVRTHRGTELAEMLTSTCPNSGCSKSVSRQEMLRYIENSGGRDYPFFTEGRVLRVATPEDLDAQQRLTQSAHALRLEARQIADPLRLPIKIVDVEPILGGERLTVFYASEQRPDLLPLIRKLQDHFRNRVDLRHVGARDEARLTADYEKCGQYCCCKNFLKVLKPISMKSAKVQKATLDPIKISGRCGRLMCCLRYEDETYEELAKRLPRKKTRVGTPEGDGLVVDSQILTQLVLVRLDDLQPDGKFRDVAVPLEDLTPPASAAPPAPREPGPRPGSPDRRGTPGAKGPRPPHAPRPTREPRPDAAKSPNPQGQPRHDQPRPPRPAPSTRNELDEIMDSLDSDSGARDDQPRPGPAPAGPDADSPRRRRRRRRRRSGPGNSPGPADGTPPAG